MKTQLQHIPAPYSPGVLLDVPDGQW